MATIKITVDNKQNARMLQKLLRSMTFVKKVESDLPIEKGPAQKTDQVQTHFASESVLAKDWLLQEEDEAWKDL